ncbi:MAG: peptidoglycan-binding protein, partial [Clostridia bacterium]|nr:peptidoglycan-binding protein [Clostridia bacterium]
EIYPNWPTNSLIANVIAQVSLALNRLYTEWYPSQGYDFDITSSTAYDQYYVHERGIFEAIDTVVDGYFTNYISVKRRLEPLFAEYCDGATTTCDGMSQWGTVSLARKNYTPLQILQYYYGTDIELRTASVQQTVAESFPGTLSLGAVSEGVLRLQNRLNRVAIAFPSIPFVIPADGRFGDSTALAVRAFQRLFRLAETGQVDRETWYRIQYIYTAVKKLAELGSEGEFPQTDAFPGRPLQSGSRGTEVLRIQRYLEYISRELGADVVPAVEVDGVYGDETAEAVRLFQNYYGLVQTGTVNEATWNAIVTSFYALGGGETDTLRPYPGTPLRRGATGEDVRWLQTMLNAVSTVDLDMPMLTVDGIFGPATEANVRRYQRNYGLAEDGIAGPLTWESLTKEYARITGVS